MDIRYTTPFSDISIDGLVEQGLSTEKIRVAGADVSRVCRVNAKPIPGESSRLRWFHYVSLMVNV